MCPLQEQHLGTHGWGHRASMEFAVDATRVGISAQGFHLGFPGSRQCLCSRTIRRICHGKDLPLSQPALKVGKMLVQGSQEHPGSHCLSSCKSFFEL